MNAYYLSLVAVAAVSELAAAISPERGREHVKRIAALTALLVILAPVRAFRERRESFAAALSSLLSPAEPDAEEASVGAQTAEFIFAYAEKLGVGRDGMTVRFQTDEAGEAERIVVTARRCPYNLRRTMEEELSRTLGVPVSVTAEEVRKE